MIEPGSYQTRHDKRCRICKKASEPIEDITAGCQMLAGRAYIKCYNQVGGIMYRNIWTKSGLEALRSNCDTPPIKRKKELRSIGTFRYRLRSR